MTSKSKQTDKGKHSHLDHRENVEDERGWAGQRGQRPANEEEKNYRTGGRTGSSGGHPSH